MLRFWRPRKTFSILIWTPISRITVIGVVLSSSIRWIFLRSFFVAASSQAKGLRWQLMFDLATNSKNLVVILNDLPDDALEIMLDLNNKRVEELNRQAPS